MMQLPYEQCITFLNTRKTMYKTVKMIVQAKTWFSKKLFFIKCSTCASIYSFPQKAAISLMTTVKNKYLFSQLCMKVQKAHY